MAINLRDRYRGALVGVLCGDALGAPYETWKAVDVMRDLIARGGLVAFDYPNPWKKEGPPSIFSKGRPTDDSDHTAALAESLIERRAVDQEDLFMRLRSIVFDHKSPLWEGRAYGAGKTTRNMLRPATWDESKALTGDDAFPSNGSLMRSVPLALFFGKRQRIDAKAVRSMSAVTHRHETAVECCDAYIQILVGILEGIPMRYFMESLPETVASPELALVLANPYADARDPEVWPGRGAAVFTLHVALQAFMTEGIMSFHAGLTHAIVVGGDTDTYGAVAGGLLGARWGIEAIPQEWQEALIGREKMIDLADRLYALAHP